MIAFLPEAYSRSIRRPTCAGNKVLIQRATGGFAALVLIYLFDPGWISSLLSWHKRCSASTSIDSKFRPWHTSCLGDVLGAVRD